MTILERYHPNNRCLAIYVIDSLSYVYNDSFYAHSISSDLYSR